MAPIRAPLRETYDALVSEIYLAGAGMRPWSAPLGTLARLTRSRHAMLHAASVRTIPSTTVYIYHDVDLVTDVLLDYADYLQEHGDPRVDYSVNLIRNGRIAEPFRDHDFISERQMKHHTYYAEILPEVDCLYALAVPIQVKGDVGVGISLQRTPRQGPVGNAAKRLVQRIAGHISCALEMQDALQIQAPERHDDVRPFQLPTSAAIIDGNGRLVAASTQMEAYLAQGLFRVRAAALEAGTPALIEPFRRAVGRAVSGKPAKVPVPERSLLIYVLPIVVEEGVFVKPAMIALVFRKQDAAPADPVAQLAARYGLTAAETATVRLLAEGCAPKEIARRRDVSVWTVRTQLRYVFHKLEVRSQQQVLARLAQYAR